MIKNKPRSVKAWGVRNEKERFVAYGNGAQFQFPIFPTRKAAKAWQQESPWDRGELSIVRVTISGADAGGRE